mmetsp:Transcript_23183/g.34514  ORF Transcript_23183/g.34514 Transcript_23183/m.34514 type:complete len:517 (-) Transcript_23183:92-1642(-)|eukprot:CAMPEP_0203685698 /NCGR_PEP_ID=MMETSP0090-20130426/48681_1 /ASSEMBLY_ACC=CAM_ASM_001088 /TAXON_ID=426623 /ORGANISM="Chaetoceros affinis, Strain CCMP159" /LENGTH=516 /DNA_ID=CAMNT_0050554903 /DNA_START=86 /DNA_END=1636 /DNA_ORIENTATION=-
MSMMSIDYKRDHYLVSNVEESIANRDWEQAYDILLILKNEDFAFHTNSENGRTLMHSLCKLRFDEDRDSNGDGKVEDGALSVAMTLIEASYNVKPSSGSVDVDVDGHVHESVLTVQDSSGYSPLHHLFGNIGDAVPADLLELILEHCRDTNNSLTLERLLGIKNLNGANALHFMCGSSACSMGVLLQVVSLLMDEYSDEQTQIQTQEKSTSIHPFLDGDDDGELPIHYACYVGLEAEELKTILDVGPLRDIAQKSLFCISDARVLPIECLLSWFLDEYEEEINHYLWLSSSVEEITYEDVINCLLDSEDEDVTNEIKELIISELWPRIQVILNASVQQNAVGDSNLPIHLTVSVPTFPLTILKTAQIVSSKRHYLVRDQKGRIPLHVAASLKPVALKSSNFREEFEYVDDNDIRNILSHQPKEEEISTIQYMLEQERSAASTLTDEGRLPLHIAIESGQNFNSVINPILNIYPRGLLRQDPKTKLFAFMLATESLDTTFRLLLIDPSLCKTFTKLT